MKLLTMAALLLSSLAAYSDVYDSGLKAALTTHRSTIADFAQSQMATRTQVALNALVQATNQALAQKGYVEEAQGYQREWDAYFSQYFTAMQAFDLGDHAPLSPWLDKYYKNAQDKLGDPVMKLLHLDDLFTLNYAIPVVFHPKGDTKGQDHWNQLEYQRHFVPFATVVTYWGSFVACRVASVRVAPIKKWCSQISMILRNVMHNSIAPKLSDKIYKKFRGTDIVLDLNYAQLEEYYQTEVMKIQK